MVRKMAVLVFWEPICSNMRIACVIGSCEYTDYAKPATKKGEASYANATFSTFDNGYELRERLGCHLYLC